MFHCWNSCHSLIFTLLVTVNENRLLTACYTISVISNFILLLYKKVLSDLIHQGIISSWYPINRILFMCFHRPRLMMSHSFSWFLITPCGKIRSIKMDNDFKTSFVNIICIMICRMPVCPCFTMEVQNLEQSRYICIYKLSLENKLLYNQMPHQRCD